MTSARGRRSRTARARARAFRSPPSPPAARRPDQSPGHAGLPGAPLAGDEDQRPREQVRSVVRHTVPSALADGPSPTRAYGRRMSTEITHTDTPHEIVGALLIRLDRIAAAAETLRSMTGHNHGELSPSLPPLLQSLGRDLLFATRDIDRLNGSLPR